MSNSKKDKYILAIEDYLYGYKSTQAWAKNIEITLEQIEMGEMNLEEHPSKEELLRLKNKLANELRIVENTLDTLTEDELKIIELKYLKRMNYKGISNLLGYVPEYMCQRVTEILNKMKPSMIYLINRN